MNNIPRHKVFISYYHKDDQQYKDFLIDKTEFNDSTRQNHSIFEDYSVREGEIRDEGLSSEQIRRIIRDDYIKDATVLILLCGKNTKHRKHIDWEIHAAMYDSDINPRMGILVINLPSIKQGIYAGNENEKTILSDTQDWTHLETRREYEEHNPFMPDRIIDNLVKDVPITVVDWDRVAYDVYALKRLIHNAYQRRTTNDYDHSRPLRHNNS